MRTSHRIALAYFGLSALWILLSDKILHGLFPDYFHMISLYKGWAFVAISALILFIFIRREERRRDTIETQLKQTAITDPLTGLRNRAALISHLEHAQQTAMRLRTSFGVILLDLDNFQRINDGQGHANGDKSLRAIARRISDSVRSSDIAARFGGDEFAVFAPNGEDLTVLAHRLLDAFQTPIKIDEEEINVSVSIGVARYPDHGDTVDEVISAADKAMFNAKESGKGCVREAT